MVSPYFAIVFYIVLGMLYGRISNEHIIFSIPPQLSWVEQYYFKVQDVSSNLTGGTISPDKEKLDHLMNIREGKTEEEIRLEKIEKEIDESVKRDLNRF